MGSTDNYISVMIDGLKKKIVILNQIIGLTNRENELLLLSPFDVDAFDANMKDKSEVVEQLIRLDDGFTAVYDRVKIELDKSRNLYEDEITQMKVLISKITELSVKIQALEARNKGLAQKKFATLKKEVKAAQSNGRIVSNYYKSMSMIDTEPQFLDKKK